jgi:hypothetical protein
MLQLAKNLLAIAGAGEALLDQPVSARRAVLRILDRLGLRTAHLAAAHRGQHAGFRRLRQRILADHHAGRRVAATDARRGDDPDAAAKNLRQPLEQRARPGQFAGQRVANAHGQRRRIAVALLHHVEMMVEGRNLVHLRLAQPHLLGERREMGGGQAPVFILDAMQMLDQEIPPPRRIPEQGANLFSRRRIHLPALASAAIAFAAVIRSWSRSRFQFLVAHARRVSGTMQPPW